MEIKKIKNKKAQIKMFETIAILVIFFILVGIGFIFYSSISTNLTQKEAARRSDLESIESAQRVAYFPELKCTSSVAKEIGSCIDYYKALTFGRLLTNPDNDDIREYYYDHLGFVTIKLSVIYPKPEEIIIYDYPKPNYRGYETFQVPIVLLKDGEKSARCGPEFSNAECDFAFLEVSTYS